MSDRYRGRDDDEEAEFDLEEAEPPKRRGRLLAAMIALFAIGGFGGVLWYAYSQGQRSADAVAPILKADGEPTRLKPEQPGGMVVPHQDKLVLNSMQQAARPGQQAERLLPPAEAPLPQTTRTAPPPAASVPLAPPPAAPAPPPPQPVPQMAAPSPMVPPTPPAATPAPPPTTTGSLVALPAPPPVPPASSASAPTPSVPTPPAPTPPPQMAARPPTPAPPPAAPRISSGSGDWRVQLGSFPAADQANAQWDRLKRAHAELQPLGPTTVRVDLGDKGVWYRLQAGPLNEPAARALCDDLKSKKRDCLVVRP